MNRTDRDIESLDCIGFHREISQGQLHAEKFEGRTEAVVTRRVRKLLEEGLVAVERVNKTGCNLLRLTGKGLDVLVEEGRREADYFVPKKSVALKDLVHSLWIVDLCVMLRKQKPAPTTVLPACQLQRRWRPTPGAIPDVLAIYELDDLPKRVVISIEVDLGAERLKSTFIPKLQRCAELLLTEWAPNDVPVIVVFTKGPRRALSLLKAASESVPVPVIVQLLPRASGRETLRLISRSFRRYRLLVHRAVVVWLGERGTSLQPSGRMCDSTNEKIETSSS
jgi:hypothetical protein